MRRQPEVMMVNEQVLARIRAEFIEMPGMRLTPAQVQRLCGVDGTLCQQVLDVLVQTKFLCVKTNGAYARWTDGAAAPRPQPAKAKLRSEAKRSDNALSN
jgi:hypothetical protein